MAKQTKPKAQHDEDYFGLIAENKKFASAEAELRRFWRIGHASLAPIQA